MKEPEFSTGRYLFTALAGIMFFISFVGIAFSAFGYTNTYEGEVNFSYVTAQICDLLFWACLFLVSSFTLVALWFDKSIKTHLLNHPSSAALIQAAQPSVSQVKTDAKSESLSASS